jgi:hypothetical protein
MEKIKQDLKIEKIFVLKNMLDQGYITDSEYAQAKAEGILFSPRRVAERILDKVPKHPKEINFYPDSIFIGILRRLPPELHIPFLQVANKILKPLPEMKK